MHPEIPTDIIALQTWWAFMWRSVLLSLAAGILIGVIIGVIAGITKADPETLNTPAVLSGGFAGIFISVKIFKRLMTKGFGQYRLQVVKK